MIFDDHPAVQAAFLSSLLHDEDQAEQVYARAGFDGDVRITGEGLGRTLPHPVTLDDMATDLDDDAD